MQNVRVKEPHLAVSSDFKTENFSKPASPLFVRLHRMYVIISYYAITQSQCWSEQYKWRAEVAFGESYISSSSLQIAIMSRFGLGFLGRDSGGKKRGLEAGNGCRETNERSCLNWHWCLKKFLCNCCLRRVLLVNLSAPSECFCVFYSTQFWAFLVFCLFWYM